MTTILVGGDCGPFHRLRPLFEAGEATRLFGGLLDCFKDADITIVNLESPLVTEPRPIEKCGPSFGAPAACVRGLGSAGVAIVNLANNHAMDQDRQGVESTISACRSAGIATIGAGRNLEEASRVLVRDQGGLRVGFMGISEHGAGSASLDSWGVNRLDLLRFSRAARDLKDALDFLVVLFHGGIEYYPYPSPGLRRICRSLVEEGAGAVICQHSHHPGTYERYREGLIIYGQGNLLFDLEGKSPNGIDWYRGFLVRLVVERRAPVEADFIPYWQCDEREGARLMSRADRDGFLEILRERSEQIRDEVFVEERWKEFCSRKKDIYLSCLHGDNRFGRRLAVGFKGLRRRYAGARGRMALDAIRCESHREVLETILSEET